MVRDFEGRGDQPWGWWLRAAGGAIEDGEGRRWPSVLDAFWHGRMGFPPSPFTGEQLELLLRVLMASDRRHPSPAETHHDLFGGFLEFRRFYMSWLVSAGLAACGRVGTPLNAELTDFGRSVLLLLQVTRD